MDVYLEPHKSEHISPPFQAIIFDMSALWMSSAAKETLWLGVLYVFLEYLLTPHFLRSPPLRRMIRPENR